MFLESGGSVSTKDKDELDFPITVLEWLLIKMSNVWLLQTYCQGNISYQPLLWTESYIFLQNSYVETPIPMSWYLEVILGR